MDFFLVLMIKHFVVDLGFQQYMGTRQKQQYFGNGHRHYLEHGIATAFIALWFAPEIAVLIGLLDYVLHWHIDWGKHHLNRLLKLETRSVGWWWTTVVDQCAHTVCYWCYAAYLV